MSGMQQRRVRADRIGEIKRWVRTVCKLTEVFGSPFQIAGAAYVDEGAVAELQRG